MEGSRKASEMATRRGREAAQRGNEDTEQKRGL